MFKDYCYLAQDADGYIKGIEEMLATPISTEEQNARRNFALSHTWEASVGGMYKAIEEFENKMLTHGQR
jgi:hypothetical protein